MAPWARLATLVVAGRRRADGCRRVDGVGHPRLPRGHRADPHCTADAVGRVRRLGGRTSALLGAGPGRASVATPTSDPTPRTRAIARLEQLGLVTARGDPERRWAAPCRRARAGSWSCTGPCATCCAWTAAPGSPAAACRRGWPRPTRGWRNVEAPVQADGDAVLGEEHVGPLQRPGLPAMRTVTSGPTWSSSVSSCRARGWSGRRRLVESAATLLVAGSSLAVGSGRLLLRHARRHGARVAIVNLGPDPRRRRRRRPCRGATSPTSCLDWLPRSPVASPEVTRPRVKWEGSDRIRSASD